MSEMMSEAMSSDALMAHMREFARRVKLSGTPEEMESFLYLKAQMEGFGYRTRLLSHDAYISLPGKATVQIDGASLRCITHSMSVSTSESGMSGSIVYVGECRPEDLARCRREGLDLAGKIWLIDGIAGEASAAASRDAGAIGEIHISPNEHLYEMCVSPVWGSPSQHTRPLLPSVAVCTIPQDEGAALRARCEAGETVTARIVTHVDTGWRKTPLLVAEMDALGKDAGAPFILLSGHHDTWHYGVMDNGGANATMLECARLLAADRAKWRRGLRVCFWSGHSHGRYSGSAWYADEYWDDLDRRCAAHVNVDSTGGAGATVLSASWVIDELKSVAAEAVHAVTGQAHEGRRHARAADQSFWGIGVPSMFGSISQQPPTGANVRTSLGWWWHTPHDLLDNIDPDFLIRDTRIVLHALHRLLCDETLPLDYADTAASLSSELSALQQALGDRIDIEGLIEATSALGKKALKIGRTGPIPDATLMAVSRALVPLNYTSGERFHHGPASQMAPWPSLNGIRALARLPHGAPDQPFAMVHARQTRNRVAHALRTALAALDHDPST